MCGIAGFFNYKTKHSVNEAGLITLLESMRYRGPDHLGVYNDSDIAMGNVRLSIQGLSEKGNQPLYNEDRSVVVVYNGEIYNYPELKSALQKKGHVFYSDTDTEVLVHLYEEYQADMANDLNGMFAFALFDIKNRTLLLGRDPTAQKPLYIEKNRQGIFFSSELKCMIPYLDGCSLNPDAVRTFLSMGYALEPQTIFNEVEALEPGSINIFNYAAEKSLRFWKFQCADTGRISDPKQWHEKADLTLKRAVQRHLLSDVPVTLMLSGGVDSSLLAFYLAQENKIKKAYTGSFVDSGSHDEYSYAERLGRYCGFEIERVRLSNQVLSDNLEEFLNTSSMPQGDNSGLATYCMAKEISKEFRVVLGGDGGDELFGGYPTYTFPYLAERYSFIPRPVISWARRLASMVSDRQKYLSLPFKLQQLSLAWGKDIIKAHFSFKDFLPEKVAADILEQSFFKAGPTARYARSALERIYNTDSGCRDTVTKLCLTDFNTFLRSATIPKVERNCMRFSLENRLPYLDSRMLDLSIRTDPLLMVDKRETKKCLKSLLKKKAYGKISLNPIKQGFSPPLVAMFNKELGSWKDHWLNSKTPFFNSGLSKSLAKWQGQGWDLHRLQWNICVLSDWCSRNKII